MRSLLSAVSLLSLMLSVAIGALWMRSYATADRFDWQAKGGTLLGVLSTSGRLTLCWKWFPENQVLPAGFSHLTFPSSTVHGADELDVWIGHNELNVMANHYACNSYRTVFEMARLRLQVGGIVDATFGPIPPPSSITSWMLILPHWVAGLLACLAPTVWVRRTIGQWRRAAKGLCLCCGYDLRPSLRRCPECGTPAQVEADA